MRFSSQDAVFVSQPEQNSNHNRLLVQDAERRADVDDKQQRVRELLDSTGADALLLQDPSNIAWFTGGADLSRCATESCHTSVFVTAEARLFATNAVDSAQIFEREAFGLGFQLKQREWFQPHRDLVDDLCRGRRVISDSGFPGTARTPDRIAAIRLPLTRLEVRRLRRLSRVATHAVEATAHKVRRGMTEAEVAGEVSHRLIKRTVMPVRIQVCADGRNERYRHWTYSEDRIENYAVIACFARRWGLHAGVCRTVALGTVPEELAEAHRKAILMHATGQYFSREGMALGEIWSKVHRIYEKFGLPGEWQRADQADIIGFTTSDRPMLPDSEITVPAPSAMYWHPSVGPAMLGDTILVRDSSMEFLTTRGSWPVLNVQVKGRDVPCPDILRLPASVADVPAESVNASAGEPADFDEVADTRRDSIWELDMPTDRSVFEEDDSPYSEESVLE